MTDTEKLQNIYVDATRFAMNEGQVVGERNDYYITLEQLEIIVRNYLDTDDTHV